MLFIQETLVNRDQDCIFSDSEPYEPFTENIGRLFRSLQKELGRCISKVYQDTPAGAVAIGWVFQKRVKYSDCKDTYIQESWITLLDKSTGRGFQIG